MVCPTHSKIWVFDFLFYFFSRSLMFKLGVCFLSLRALFQAVELFPLPSAVVPPWAFLYGWENSPPALPACLWFPSVANLCSTGSQNLNRPLLQLQPPKWLFFVNAVYKHTIQSSAPILNIVNVSYFKAHERKIKPFSSLSLQYSCEIRDYLVWVAKKTWLSWWNIW